MATDARIAILKDCAQFYANPLGFVMWNWPWGKPGTFLEHHDGPDAWQREFLEEVGEAVRQRKFDGVHAVTPIRMAVASGHGIGKSTLSAWLTTWILCTRPHSRGTLSASSWQQLNARTWATLTRWLQAGIVAPLLEISQNKIWFRDAGDRWFAIAQSCSPENATSFQGQHAADSTSFFVFDEASGVDDRIFEAALGGLTDGEPMMFLFGNPTQPSGFFHRACFGSDRNYWLARSVSSWDAKFTNKEQLAEWRTQWGETSDWYKVRVLGEPPTSAFNQLIETSWVAAARKFKAEGYEQFPKIFGCDVARYGDDRSVVMLRQGRRAQTLGIFRGIDTVQFAERIAALIEEHHPAAVVVDCDGLGVGTFDALRHRGYEKLHEFHGGGRPNDPNAYFNRRAEIWKLMADWLKAGSCQIPDSVEMELDLCGSQYGFSPKGAIQLEPKDALKSRGLASPDLADALAMTFAAPVAMHRKPARPRFICAGPHSRESWMA